MSAPRQYVPGPQRAKVGNTEIRLTKEMMSDIRNRWMAMNGVTVAKAAEDLAKVYPQVSPLTIEAYIRGARVHNDVFKLYLEDKVSFSVLEDVGPMDPDTGLFLVTEMIERKLSPVHIKKAKIIMKEGEAKSWDEALKKASGEARVPILPPSHRKSSARSDPRSFDDLLRDVMFVGTEWRLKVKSVIDMLPQVSTQAEGSFATFNKLYMLRNTLSEQFEFVDKTVKAVLDRMMKRASVQEVPAEEEIHDAAHHRGEAQVGGEEGEAGAPEVHGARQALSDSPGQEEVP